MTEYKEEPSQQMYNEAVKLAPMSIVDVPKKFRNKELWDIILDMDLGVSAYLLLNLPINFLSTDMCEHFVDTQCNLIQYVPKELMTRKMCENAINEYAYTIRFVPINILTLKMCRIAVTQAVETFKYVPLEPPYFLFSEHGKEEIVKIWTKNKKKIILWYLYKITRIKWFIKKYNEQTR
jgi:hypothetical protein